MSYHFIINPKAGRGRGASAWRTLQTELIRNNVSYKVSFTQHAGHIAELIPRVSDADTIVAIGGDGTIHDLVNALFASHRLDHGKSSAPRVGWIPAGTGNDFARTLHIPTKPHDAWHVLQRGVMRRIDLGLVNGRVFLNISGVGFDAKVAHRVSRSRYPAIGPIPYLLSAFRTLATHRNPYLTIRLDDVNLSQKALLIAIGNCRYYGGGMMICPRAVEDDGLLDICLAGNLNRIEVLRAVAASFKGKHLGLPRVTYHRGQTVTIEGPRNLPIHADGQIVGTLPARYELLPGALYMVCPPKTDRQTLPAHEPPHVRSSP